MLDAYQIHVTKRKQMGLPALPLTAEQTAELVSQILSFPSEDAAFLKYLLVERVAPGVDPAAEVKAKFLYSLCTKENTTDLITPDEAVFLLGTMRGGFNVAPLIACLDLPDLAEMAAKALSGLLFVYDGFDTIAEKAKTNTWAETVLKSWAAAEWFTELPALEASRSLTVFRVEGEINTDDFSPAGEAWSRPDIPLHSLSMLGKRMPGAMETLADLKKDGLPLVFVGDVVGTGSSRKSAANSLIWHIGDDIPYVPNKRRGGVVLGGKIAPIFFNTVEDSGGLPIECDVCGLSSGDVIRILPYAGEIQSKNGDVITRFTLKSEVLLDAVQAGGRIPLIAGRSLTAKARALLGMGPADMFRQPPVADDTGTGFTLAQKMVGKACGQPGVRPGTYCEPKMTTVGSQDTTGPMTRDEMAELSCLKFSADLVMQSFCHTAAYPKPVDVTMHNTLPGFITRRGGVSLKPGDGVIHSWLNRMLVPDTVGTGGDSHTRFPVGISFPSGSGLVAFGAAMGMMPLDMPESVRVRLTGTLAPEITWRDVVNAIPLAAIEQGLLTVEKEGKKNIFSGRILEIEGCPDLSVDEAFELTDASAERSAAAATIQLNPASVIAFVRSNTALLKQQIADGYADAETLGRRVADMEAWLADPVLLTADPDAGYAATVDVDLSAITEPVLACPNDPDDVKRLSEVAGTKVDEVFIGSCMTHIGHFRAAAALLDGNGEVPVRLWMTPPTRMDADQLKAEGLYSVFGKAGARMEVPGCSLCMGNQARVSDNAVVVSTSTRNFPDRVGNGAKVYLGSAELAAITAVLGRIPTADEYTKAMAPVVAEKAAIYRFLAFDAV